MAWEQPLFNLTFQAAKSLITNQFEVVNLSTAGKITTVSSDGAPFVGILQDKPTSGAEANVMAIGISKVKAGGAIGRGQRLIVNFASTSNGGSLIASTCSATPVAGDVGYALEASAQAGDIIAAVINFKS